MVVKVTKAKIKVIGTQPCTFLNKAYKITQFMHYSYHSSYNYGNEQVATTACIRGFIEDN